MGNRRTVIVVAIATVMGMVLGAIAFAYLFDHSLALQHSPATAMPDANAPQG